jgi:hypothetical protein
MNKLPEQGVIANEVKQCHEIAAALRSRNNYFDQPFTMSRIFRRPCLDRHIL